MKNSSVLVIAPRDLGKFVVFLGAAAAIRAYHRNAAIVLLTPNSTAQFAKAAPYFDEVWNLSIRGAWDIGRIRQLRTQLSALDIECTYDFESSHFSNTVFWALFGLRGLPFRRKGLSWSGVSKQTGLFAAQSHWNAMHIKDRWTAQLAAAGIPGMLRADLSWVARQVQSFNVPFRMDQSFALVCLDSNANLLWPLDMLASLVQSLADDGISPVLIGHDEARELADVVTLRCDATINVVGAVSLEDLVFLSWAACAAVGPDSGLMHLTSTAGCHTVVLYDSSSDPALTGQRGDSVIVLRRPALSDISVNELMSAVLKSSKIRTN